MVTDYLGKPRVLTYKPGHRQYINPVRTRPPLQKERKHD